MRRSGTTAADKPIGAFVWFLYAVALATALAIAYLFPIGSIPLATGGMLLALAMLAEVMPVQHSRRGLRITLTLPFVAGICSADGPTSAMLADGAITLLATLALAHRDEHRLATKWASVNVATALISAGLAGSMHNFLTARSSATVGDFAFVATYVVINFLIVTRTASENSSRPFYQSVLRRLQSGLFFVGFYGLVGVAVCLVVERGVIAILPLFLVPVFALRTALQMSAKSEEHYYETMVALTLMLQRSHPYTHRHLERVGHLAEMVALQLGLTPRRAIKVREAAILHDIGKIAIDEEVLDKPGTLSEDEMDHVRMHPEFGAEILTHSEEFREIVPWIRSHHERPDGKGYPGRLQDVEIPIESKIIAVTDAFDAMVGGAQPEETRSYRIPMQTDEALAELERCAGTQFDRRVVAVFSEVVESAGAT